MSAVTTSLRVIVCISLAMNCCGCWRNPGLDKPTSSDSIRRSEGDETAGADAIEAPEISVAPDAQNSPPVAAKPAAALDPDGNSYALLVGCTTYDHLGEDSWLRGPINDVHMMRDVLIDLFDFGDENIRCLTEGQSEGDRPTKANIVRELDRLSETVGQGDRVVLLLSGHGSQQPDNDPDNEEDPEPDGLDEIFCPADLQVPEDFTEPYMLNALSDDELRISIGAIRKKGAFTWVIVDACHSGSSVRGTEVYRQISPDKLFPEHILAEAKRRSATNTRSIQADRTSFEAADAEDNEGGLVAIYAAQPHEPTLEMILPEESEDSQWRGLLTYTLVKVLTSAESPLTYNELVQRVHSEYIHSFGRLGPTPLIEGVDQNREVMGQTEPLSRSRISLSINPQGQFIATVGELHGFSAGSLFAVYPPPGEKRTESPLGHVQIVRSQLLESTVEPVEPNGASVTAEFPIGAQLEVVELRPGQLSLKVAFDDQSESGPDSPSDESIPELLRTIESEPGRRVEYAETPQSADWIVRRTLDNQLYLLPAAGWSEEEKTTHFGPAPAEGQAEWLSERLGRISRVRSLLKLCDASQRQATGGLFSFLMGKKPCQVALKILSMSPSTGEASNISWTERNWTLNDGEQVVLEIENTGSETVDFSVLFIDSEFGITPLFPSFGIVADNRLQPNQKYSLGPLQVEASTLGLEHLVVIATKAQGQPVDFSWLGQESLETFDNATRAASNQHPLGVLFRDVLYSKNTTRGMKIADAENTCLRAISWKTVNLGVVRK